MKKFLLMLPLFGILSATFIGGSGGCGGSTASDIPPNVEGTYALTNANPAACSQVFDSEVIVVQDGDNVILQATHVGFTDASGTINNDGEFSISGSSNSFSASCDGQFVSGVGLSTCTGNGTTCDITYTRQ